MATTQELQAAAVVNAIIGTTAQLYAIGQQIDQLSAQWTNLSVANKINAFPTAALSSTGGLGAADSTPVTSDPINVQLSPGTEISRAISANNLASLLTYLQGVAAAIAGTAVSANGAAAQLVALCL